jgi:hypothetical protein
MLNRIVNHLVVEWIWVHFHVVIIKSKTAIGCGRSGASLEACSKDKTCSDERVHAYMARYGTYCTGGRAPTCEDYARVHNGGPLGCRESATIPYWQKVQVCYGQE